MKTTNIFYIILFLIPIFISSCNNINNTNDTNKKSTALNNNDIDIREESVNNSIIVGTFNIKWLGDGIDDNTPRNQTDINNIANIIKDMDYDILAIQEIENANAIKRILKILPDYKYILSDKFYPQNIGVIYKKNIDVSMECNYKPLSLDGRSRPGLVLNIKANNYKFNAMVVHLKASSRYDSTDALKEKSYELRRSQAQMLSNWVDSMIAIGKEDLIILGDFNDFVNRKNNATLTPLLENPNLTCLTAKEHSCSNPYHYTIDNIFVSNSIKKRFVETSLFTYDIHSSFNDEEIETISDHCPISIQLKIEEDGE